MGLKDKAKANKENKGVEMKTYTPKTMPSEVKTEVKEKEDKKEYAKKIDKVYAQRKTGGDVFLEVYKMDLIWLMMMQVWTVRFILTSSN